MSVCCTFRNSLIVALSLSHIFVEFVGKNFSLICLCEFSLVDINGKKDRNVCMNWEGTARKILSQTHGIMGENRVKGKHMHKVYCAHIHPFVYLTCFSL